MTQGTILRNVVRIETVEQLRDDVVVSKVIYPYVIVLSQDCDLDQDYRSRWPGENAPKKNNDKELPSVLVAPLYVAQQVKEGTHLEDLGLTMTSWTSRTHWDYITSNQNARFHHMMFADNEPLPDLIIDFKHFFTVSSQSLYESKEKGFVCRLDALFREDVSLRFANYLSRIGLPEHA